MKGRLLFRKDFRKTQNNSAILSQVLFWLATRKEKGSSDSGWFRSSAVPQLIWQEKGTLFLYESGYRGSIYPRYRWSVFGFEIADALLEALCYEIESKELIAQIDGRKAASVEHIA